ncbi:hypothetical protein M316_0014 [Nitrincola phage 1M3-16]|uniref:hypothetical protein n=1 Tax=Nitrincola phage 1M3-16 TaxID=1472912 RepID=UPI000444D7F0|nr:hypothetical protein GJ22_gp138 [Nitrincola phage 1M3-16]AHX01079.1 hypothetical protein M316_0014 [Nitrincola phage 1M3-16]
MSSNIADLYEQLFGEKQQKEAYKMEHHQFNGRVGGKAYCTRCGLVSLNNSFTRWAADKGCLNELHPSYKSQRNKSGGI